MEKWLDIIKAQQRIVIGKDGNFQKDEFDLASDEEDEWVKWNKERDAALEENR